MRSQLRPGSGPPTKQSLLSSQSSSQMMQERERERETPRTHCGPGCHSPSPSSHPYLSLSPLTRFAARLRWHRRVIQAHPQHHEINRTPHLSTVNSILCTGSWTWHSLMADLSACLGMPRLCSYLICEAWQSGKNETSSAAPASSRISRPESGRNLASSQRRRLPCDSSSSTPIYRLTDRPDYGSR